MIGEDEGAAAGGLAAPGSCFFGGTGQRLMGAADFATARQTPRAPGSRLDRLDDRLIVRGRSELADGGNGR